MTPSFGPNIRWCVTCVKLLWWLKRANVERHRYLPADAGREMDQDRRKHAADVAPGKRVSEVGIGGVGAAIAAALAGIGG